MSDYPKSQSDPDSPEKAAAAEVPITCDLGGGVQIVTTREDCANLGGTVVAKPTPTELEGSPITLVTCKHPSGKSIKATKTSCGKVHGNPT